MHTYLYTSIFSLVSAYTKPPPDKVETMIKDNPSLTLKDISMSSEAEGTLFKLYIHYVHMYACMVQLKGYLLYGLFYFLRVLYYTSSAVL